MSDIVERLRETASCADYIVDREIAAEAADTITRLTAEMEKLRAALEEIIQDSFSVYAIQVARAALEGKQ